MNVSLYITIINDSKKLIERVTEFQNKINKNYFEISNYIKNIKQKIESDLSSHKSNMSIYIKIKNIFNKNKNFNFNINDLNNFLLELNNIQIENNILIYEIETFLNIKLEDFIINEKIESNLYKNDNQFIIQNKSTKYDYIDENLNENNFILDYETNKGILNNNLINLKNSSQNIHQLINDLKNIMYITIPAFYQQLNIIKGNK